MEVIITALAVLGIVPMLISIMDNVNKYRKIAFLVDLLEGRDSVRVNDILEIKVVKDENTYFEIAFTINGKIKEVLKIRRDFLTSDKIKIEGASKNTIYSGLKEALERN